MTAKGTQLCGQGDRSKRELWYCKQVCYKGPNLKKDQRVACLQVIELKQKQIKSYLAIWCSLTNGKSKKETQTSSKELIWS